MSTTAVGRRHVHWLIPALVLCIAIPAVISMQACKKAEEPATATAEKTTTPGTTGLTASEAADEVKPAATTESQTAASKLRTTITFSKEEDTNRVCPDTAQFKVSVGSNDEVAFVNKAGVPVIIVTTNTQGVATQAFDQVEGPCFCFAVPPNTGSNPVVKKVWSNLSTNQTIELTMYLRSPYTVDGCTGFSKNQYGPGMQVNQ